MKKSYSKKQNDVSKIAKALGHPARVAILELLSGKELTCNQIVEELPLAQATVSQHLKELKNRITSYNVCYTKLLRRSIRHWLRLPWPRLMPFSSVP